MHRLVGALFFSVCLAGFPRLSAAQLPHAGSRLRPLDARAASILALGIERSETFSQLVQALERSAVIVYIEFGRQPGKQMGAHLRLLATAGDYRYLRILISPETTQQGQIVLLGHELQHALEIANEPEVIDERSFRRFYERIGVPGTIVNGYDTLAARDVERRVHLDLTTVHARRTGDRALFQ